MALDIVRVVIAVFTVFVGIYSILWPGRIKGFTGLSADSPRAISEIRAVMGGVFVALGVAPLAFMQLDLLRVLGLVYLVIAVVRLASIYADRSRERSNWISLASEVAMAVLLLVGWP